jgi:hypothetical protein
MQGSENHKTYVRYAYELNDDQAYDTVREGFERVVDELSGKAGDGWPVFTSETGRRIAVNPALVESVVEMSDAG